MLRGAWNSRFYNQINVYATSKLVSLPATRELAHAACPKV